MLAGATILVFADDWGAHPSSAQHLFRRFLGANRVVWVNTVGQRLPRLTLGDARKVARKLAAWTGLARAGASSSKAGGIAAGGGRGESETAAAAPEVVDLALLPIPLGAIARRANARRLRGLVGRLLDEAPPGAPRIVVSTLPLTADLAGALSGATFAYYLVDDYASWPGIGADLLRRMDEEQIARADIVIAASRALADMARPRARGDVAYLPHGVDVAHFARARILRDERRRARDALEADVLFFGAIDERIDQDLLLAVARARPALRFLILGPSADARPELLAAPNIARRDALPYARLPEALAGARATILPYVQTDFGKRLSPLKAREALAAGLPVVATEVPELATLGRGVRLGRTATEVASALDAALAAPEDVPSLEALAADSWEARAARMSELLSGARP